MKKYIVTNKGCLKKKYLNDITSIEAAFVTLIAADKANGITTVVVYMDDSTQMSSLGASVITKAASARQTKRAIDSLFTAQTPDQVTIFGAQDVVAFQSLSNPMIGDIDEEIPSDLPYASNAGYNTDVTKFFFPSRDITRLPDLYGGTDITYPVREIANASNQSQKSPADYGNYFAISNDAWRGSTTTSVNNIFRNTTKLNISPPAGPKWSNSQLQAMTYFFNLHGGSSNPSFYNNDGISITSTDIVSGLSQNVAISVECCYGAQLYTPVSNVMGMCSAAMYAGCCGYFGSTNIAYGPPNGQGQADIITQKFLIHLLAGKSIGQAALSARTDFIAASDMSLPSNQKTIGQFLVYGNGGFVPVDVPTEDARKTLEEIGVKFSPKNLREENEVKSLALKNTVDISRHLPDKRIPKFVNNAIDAILEKQQPESHSIMCHQVVFNRKHTKLMKDADQTFIYTVHAKTGTGETGDRYTVHHIKANNKSIIDVYETHSK